ncbi:isoprenoid synthase domain-containing protein [Aspergillus sergii]|uniref:Isoprenoid synthase domain-containing protein n=1 Tax=Aspergillus sergii TaxID=1034303 RepID=A0A5N6XI77_9EURO|nr:isoprenoid synthase domain-containing protein [Aspergillus sergii]
MSLLISAQEYHASRIDPGPIPSTFEEFMERRLVYSGFHVFAKFIGLAMDFRAPDEFMSMIEDVTRPLERSMALSNDYFSWPKDKEHFQQGKGANTVAFLQQVEGISEEEALESIKRQTIALEESHNSALERLMNASIFHQAVQLRNPLVRYPEVL